MRNAPPKRRAAAGRWSAAYVVEVLSAHQEAGLFASAMVSLTTSHRRKRQAFHPEGRCGVVQSARIPIRIHSEAGDKGEDHRGHDEDQDIGIKSRKLRMTRRMTQCVCQTG